MNMEKIRFSIKNFILGRSRKNDRPYRLILQVDPPAFLLALRTLFILDFYRFDLTD